MILKDSWVGLIKTPQITEAAPIINRCTINISEIYSGTGEYSPMANAKFEISDLDIDSSSLTGISVINVDMATYDNQSSYLEAHNYLPSKWTRVESIHITKTTNSLIGENNLISFILRNIPTHPNGFLHKFRIQFLNNALTPATTNYTFSTNILGTLSSNVFTTSLAYSFKQDLYGFSFNLLDSNNKILNLEPVVSYKSDGANLYLCSNISFIEGKSSSNVASIVPVDSSYIYGLGFNGLGEEFNGIDDLGEIAGVLNLEAEPIKNTWVTDADFVFPLATDSVRLRFKNMYNHRTLNNVTMANGDVRSISETQWNSGEYYVVYMRVSSINTRPTSLWPDRTDVNGKWYRVQELPAIKKDYSEYPTITTTINGLSRGKYICFFVGMMTKYSNSTSTIEPPEIANTIYKHEMNLNMDITWPIVVS